MAIYFWIVESQILFLTLYIGTVIIYPWSKFRKQKHRWSIL